MTASPGKYDAMIRRMDVELVKLRAMWMQCPDKNKPVAMAKINKALDERFGFMMLRDETA